MSDRERRGFLLIKPVAKPGWALIRWVTPEPRGPTRGPDDTVPTRRRPGERRWLRTV